jgi:hypothetical protein
MSTADPRRATCCGFYGVPRACGASGAPAPPFQRFGGQPAQKQCPVPRLKSHVPVKRRALRGAGGLLDARAPLTHRYQCSPSTMQKSTWHTTSSWRSSGSP